MRRASTAVLAAIATATLASCGGGTSTTTSPAAAVKTYLTALGNGNGAAACGVLSTATQNQALSIARSQGIKASSCAGLFSQLRSQMTTAQRRTVLNAKIGQVTTHGNTATVTLKGGTRPATLTKSGGKWLITGGIVSG